MGQCFKKECNTLLHNRITYSCTTCHKQFNYCITCDIPKSIKCCRLKYMFSKSTQCQNSSHNHFTASCKCGGTITYCRDCNDPKIFTCCGKDNKVNFSVNHQYPKKIVKQEYSCTCTRCNTIFSSFRGYEFICFSCQHKQDRIGKCQHFICPELAGDSGYCNKHEKRKCLLCENNADEGYKICMKHYNECRYCGMSKFNHYYEREGENKIVRDYFCIKCNNMHGNNCSHQFAYTYKNRWNEDQLGYATCPCTNPYSVWTPKCRHQLFSDCMKEYKTY